MAVPGKAKWSVETRNLTKTYKVGKNAVQALQGIDLQIEAGAFVSVMGRSGSGKSTLLNMLGCLDRPTGGKVLIDGQDVTSLPDRALPQVRREKIGFMFQQHNLIPSLTALENVLLPMKYARIPKGIALRRASELLQWVGLEERAHHLPSELSGGQQARVALARALANEPAIVLADEPTGALDSRTASEMVGLMRRLSQSTGNTFIIVTHDPLVAERTDRIYHMLDGRIIDVQETAAAAAPAEVKLVEGRVGRRRRWLREQR